MTFRLLRLAHPLLLGISVSLTPLAVAMAEDIPAQADVPAQAYDIPAGPLDAALNQFGQAAGVLIIFDPALAAGRESAGLQGRYGVRQGLAALLAGTALEAVPGPKGFSLRPLVEAAGSASSLELDAVGVVGDWLGEAKEADVLNHPGARDVVRREQFAQVGASSTREVLNRIPGVNAPENNGTGSHDLALNFGIRGLNPRLATRSTVLMDGIPVPFAPYGQPQLSLAPVSMGNMDAVDVVRGGGAVRYGPQNVGGIVNFVTRAIPEDFSLMGAMQTEVSPSSSQDGFKRTGNLLIGGTGDNGLGGALLYSGVRGGDFREHSDTRIDDLILKGRFQFDDANSFHAITQYYDGEADMPGGLSVAAFDADPYQSTRPYDKFWGRRALVAGGYDYAQDERKFSVNTFFTKTLRSGYLDQGSFTSLSPRYYWVRGIETRFSQGFALGDSWHEVGIGHRYISEASHEQRYRVAPGRGLPSTSSRNDRDTRGSTEANALFIDDRIDIGNWTITPGVRYERIRSEQTNKLNGRNYEAAYNTALPALNVTYHMSQVWKLYANTEGSFGAIQYSQMPNRANVDEITPEKARTWEVGTRFDDGVLKSELGLFLINFDHQYDSNQTNNSVIARGETRHRGIEAAVSYKLEDLWASLAGIEVYGNYAFVDATIREEGPNKGNRVPFSSRHKGMLGVSYSREAWRFNLDTQFQSAQFADNENTDAESADGSTGRIPGYGIWNGRAAYAFGPQLSDLEVAVGVKNLFDKTYFTRSFDDNNKGKYLGQPRTLYLQTSFAF
ncbi:TonB-dependent Fe(3+) dicitrate receptor FecA [Metapseudomonas otitidis]|uniref:TonB-dependent Fe(3+) dicitrate receptor FecA n=1 Tax=Metapseudomonas otitidis TaxID=319939 RepID=UPI00245150AE|nr:TonB-dependent siderophore receptor [Pseudomonas otitidis]